tara:strand:+ start:3969 stop:4292 length:324 start_codon:yes stop_codon:yes gene_type:complete
VEVINFFSEEGPINSKLINNLYQPFRFHNESKLLFKTLEELGQFALEVCQETSSAEVFILSNVDYNIGLDTCNDARSFRELFRRYGNVIENPDQSRKKSNIFNKFFN